MEEGGKDRLSRERMDSRGAERGCDVFGHQQRAFCVRRQLVEERLIHSPIQHFVLSHSVKLRCLIVPMVHKASSSTSPFIPSTASVLVSGGGRGWLTSVLCPVLQAEIVKRLSAICAQIIPFLSQEVGTPLRRGLPAPPPAGWQQIPPPPPPNVSPAQRFLSGRDPPRSVGVLSFKLDVGSALRVPH